MEPTEKMYVVFLPENKSNLFKLLQKRGYTINESPTTRDWDCQIGKNGRVIAEGYKDTSLVELKIVVDLSTPEGRTLDQFLAEWTPRRDTKSRRNASNDSLGDSLGYYPG